MFDIIKTPLLLASILLGTFFANAAAAETVQYSVGGYTIECENPGYAGVHPEIPTCTHNLLVQGIDQRMNRIIQELQRQVSGRVTAFSVDDKERIDQEFAWLVAFIDLGTQSMMDFHYLTTFDLKQYEMHQPATENEAVNGAVGYLVGANANMRISQSTRLNDGMLASDKKDLMDAIAKAKSMLDAEYLNFNPLDMPQSSPSADVATPTN